MTDEELITAVREQRGNVHMTTPVGQVISRGHAVRVRRRIRGAAGALAMVTGVAVLAVTALSPASHQRRPQPSAQLAAWTVIKQSDGNIDVTIRQLSDPAGLQNTLRGDGVPAVVDFNGQPPPECQPYPMISRALASRIVQPPRSDVRTGGTVLIIDPSALPGGAGVQIGTTVSPGHIHVNIDLVYASPQCTGN
jgi:hypothetical protein